VAQRCRRGVAIGAAGVDSLQSFVNAPDLFGRPLRVTEIAAADEIAAAASLLMDRPRRISRGYLAGA